MTKVTREPLFVVGDLVYDASFFCDLMPLQEVTDYIWCEELNTYIYALDEGPFQVQERYLEHAF